MAATPEATLSANAFPTNFASCIWTRSKQTVRTHSAIHSNIETTIAAFGQTRQLLLLGWSSARDAPGWSARAWLLWLSVYRGRARLAGLNGTDFGVCRPIDLGASEDTALMEISDDIPMRPELAYYYPEPYWVAHESSWIKSLLLFFDGVAILLPNYMTGRELVADPSLAEPLADLGLLTVLEPEWFVDDQLSNRLAEGMVELITGGAFDGGTGDPAPFDALSMSRMGFAELSMSRMGSRDRGVFDMIHDELKARGLARDTEDGLSIPLRRDVRQVYLLLLAQEAREAGQRQGLDLQPITNGRNMEEVIRRFLELAPMPSREDVVAFDLATASIDLDAVPLDEVLDFRSRHRDEHRDYMLNLRLFIADVSAADPTDRSRLLQQRQARLNDQARGLTKLTLAAFKRPTDAGGFGLGLTGAAWSLAAGNPVPAGLAALGAALRIAPSREAGSAYSYIFRAHRQWG